MCSRLLALCVALLLASPAIAQEIVSSVETLEPEDPEAWAMQLFAAISLPTGLGPPSQLGRGDLSLTGELLQIPHLDQRQRTVGFGGFKEEDLNRSPAAARLRAGWGLGGGWTLEGGFAPPVEIDGVEALLLSVAVEKRLWSGPRADGALRLHGLSGEIKGDLTCTEGADHLFPPGSAENPFGCEAPSNDEMSIESYGLEALASWKLRRTESAPKVFAGVSWTRHETEFQVDALTFGFRDRALLLAEDDAFAARLGVSGSWRRSLFGGELLYAPLDVRRRGEGGRFDPVESDDLVQLRLFWRLRLR